MRIAVPMPVYGRHPLVKLTIERLFKQSSENFYCGPEINVICIGNAADREVCESAGASFYEFPNSPLGAKWQFGFTKARELEPDAVLYAGSSDWFSHNWCDRLLKNLYWIVGKRDIYFVDVSSTGIVGYYWPYYPHGPRHDETIGAGRIIRSEALDACDWKVFALDLKHSLDYSMEQNVGHAIPVIDHEAIALSISTDMWSNKHSISKAAHHSHPLTKQRLQYIIETYFPEIHHIFPGKELPYHGMSPLSDG